MTNRRLEAGSVDAMVRPPPKLIAKVIPEYGRNALLAAAQTRNPDKIEAAIGLCKTLYPNLFRKETAA